MTGYKGADYNKTILKASAGTGKTYRLSLEFLGNLIRNVDYKDIVVMTFTKKATAEIKERIYDFLYEIAFDGEKGKELSESLKSLYGFTEEDIDRKQLQKTYFEMIKNKDEVRIYTIDGFTNRIFKMAIAPSLGVYSYETVDKEEDVFYGQILSVILNNEEYFKKLEVVIREKGDKKKINTYINFIKKLANLQKDFLLAKDCKNNEKTGFDDNFLECIQEIFKNIENVAEIKNNKGKKEKKPVIDYINKNYQKIYLDFKKIDGNTEGDIEKNKRKKIDIILEDWELFYDAKLEKSSKFWNGNKVKGKEVNDILEELNETREGFLNSLSRYIYSERILPFHEQIKDFAEDVYHIMEKTKISSKRFTHDDISTYTYKFIFDEKLKFIKEGRVTEDFLDLIGGRLETVMIDEFQDTSILQWKILQLLILNAKNVICVGDEKQSIYGWRGGEKELFEKLEGIINGRVENLGKSYRSYKEIIENINNIYDGYSKDWNYIPVEYRNDEDYQRGYFSYVINKVEKNSDEDEYRAYEVIIEMIKEGKIKNLGKSCIICRTNSHLDEIVKRLNEEGIPYTLNSSASILGHGGIQPLYKLMKYFVFNNMTYLLEFMRSDLIGCLNSHVKYILENKKEIENYIKGYGEEDFLKYIDENKENGEFSELKKINFLERNQLLFSDVLYKIRSLKKLSENLNSLHLKENFSRKIIEDFEVIKYYPTNSDIKNIFKFFNILKEYNNMYEFIRNIEDNKDKLTQLSSTDVDALNLMTVHKSKGLEFDTVFYYKRNLKNESSKNDDIISYLEYDNNFGLVEKFLVILKKYKKALLDKQYIDLIERFERKEKIEEINNDYVAMTRAKKNLILLLDVKGDDNGEYITELASRLSCQYGGEEEFSVGKITETEKKISFSKKEEYEELGKIMPYFTDNRAKINKSGYKISLEKEFRRKKGLAIHYYFEHVLNDLSEDLNIAKTAILNKYGNILGKSLLNELIDRMDKFILNNSSIYSPKYKVYTEFEIYDDNGEKRIIDRINIDERNKKVYIYDYKTGYEVHENKKYIEQIENYKKILGEKLGKEYKIYTEILEV